MDQLTELRNLAKAVLNGSPERIEELLGKSAGIVHALARIDERVPVPRDQEFTWRWVGFRVARSKSR